MCTLILGLRSLADGLRVCLASVPILSNMLPCLASQPFADFIAAMPTRILSDAMELAKTGTDKDRYGAAAWLPRMPSAARG